MFVCSPRRGSGPYRGGGAAVPQTFERTHPSLSSAGDAQSSVNQPPRFSRRVEPTVVEPRVTVAAAAPAPLAAQSIAVVPAAVMPQPPAPVALAEQSNPPPTRYGTC